MSPWHQLYAAALALLERPPHARVTEGAPVQDLRRAVERVERLLDQQAAK